MTRHVKFHWQVDHATKYKHNLVRYLWKLCYATNYAKLLNEATVILSPEKEMIMMGDLNPIMYRWTGWREKVTKNFRGRILPRSGRDDPDGNNPGAETSAVELENGRGGRPWQGRSAV